MGYSAKIIADSLAPNGARLTTMEVTFPRFILAEFNTHRMFSRNSASSRAIPIEKVIRRVQDDPFIPERWPINQKGMQAEGFYPPESDQARLALAAWLNSLDVAEQSAKAMAAFDIHKQIANRLLEPFMWHTCIVSATEWNNFFALRCHPAAQPEMQKIAEMMREEYLRNEPFPAAYCDWHLPYLSEDDKWQIRDLEIAKKVSVARCARVSYLTHDGKRSIEADLELFDKLYNAVPPHLSPFEHVARPVALPKDVGDSGILARGEFIGNFRGWRQYRKEIPGESGEGQEGRRKLRSRFQILSQGHLVGRKRAQELDGQTNAEATFDYYWRLFGEGYPKPEPNLPHKLDGHSYEIDRAWPVEMVAVECQGSDHHKHRDKWLRDLERTNILQIHGWIVLQYAPEILERDPESFIWRVKQALRRSR